MKTEQEINTEIARLESEKQKLKELEVKNASESYAEQIFQKGYGIELDDVIAEYLDGTGYIQSVKIYIHWKNTPYQNTFKSDGIQFEYDCSGYNCWYILSKPGGFSIKDIVELAAKCPNNTESFSSIIKRKQERSQNKLELLNNLALEVG